MEAKSPVRHHCGSAHDLAVLLSDLYWGGAGEEIKVENAAESVVFEVLVFTRSVVDYEVYAVAVEEEYTVCLLGRHAMFEIDGMISIEVGADGDLIGITRPQSSDIVCHCY